MSNVNNILIGPNTIEHEGELHSITNEGVILLYLTDEFPELEIAVIHALVKGLYRSAIALTDLLAE